MAGRSPGRERAIETLIDMEPQGAFYRAARILEESVPSALSSRPNLVTRSALVEQAHALSVHEVDSENKYNALFGCPTVPAPSSPPPNSKRVDFILRHFQKLETSNATAPLVSALCDVCDPSDSPILRSLIRAIMSHKAIGQEDSSPIHQVILNVVRLTVTSEEADDQVLIGLLIASLSILTGSILSAEKGEGSLKQASARGEYLDPAMPTLQVASLVSLLPCKDDSSSAFHLDEAILDYLGQAAATWEERIEIQESRKAAPTDEDSPLTPVPVAPLTPTANEVDEEEEEAEEGHSDSDSTDDSDMPAPELRQVEMHNDDDDDDDSSSSSSDSEDEPAHMELHDDEDEDDASEDDEVEEDDMLREALALSLAEQGPLFAAQAEALPSEQQDETTTTQEAATDPSSFATPVATEINKAHAVSSEDDESSLPPMPVAPSHYPYTALLDSLSDLDMDRSESKDLSRQEEGSVYLDPSELSKFGSIPSAHALVHLLRYTLLAIQRRRETKADETNEVNSIPGGIGSCLFEPRLLPYACDAESKPKEDSDHTVTIQLLVSTFLIMGRNRTHAIENLRLAIAAEQRNIQGDDEDSLEEHSPLSVEDDPALALAMNCVEDDLYVHDSSDTSESLENKGMRRKAAAAAHDAAARLKSLRKQTEAWRRRVKLLSQCTVMTMKCLREYLQSTVSRWLRHISSPQNTRAVPSVADFYGLLPSAMTSKLSKSFDVLMTPDSFRSLASLLSGDDSSEMEDLFRPLELYREALSTWGECLPLMFPTNAARTEILTSTLEGCMSSSITESTNLETLESLPFSDFGVQGHKLQILCRRFCVSDLLNGLVARPKCYTTDESQAKAELFGEGGNDETHSPFRFSVLVKLVGSTAATCEEGARADLERLYLALCHRCNVQVLLWDGLFACSQVDADEILVSSPTAALSANESIRVSPNPSSSLHFDPTKCSDSIAILSNHTDSSSSVGGPSAHQRASKVWGTVLSSSFYSPKTGVHRWAIRLDKCERGHVFVGVATAQASTRTYVGGDKFGWGVIGTQALWHDRRKIRGDYGATFRTGSTIIVTLDTDAGTLSFSSWKDSSSSSASFSLDPSPQSSVSPLRRLSQTGGGTMEDWGVAFEGLPLDSKLYPAVGLYQRDDRVTLLNVESAGRSRGRDGLLDDELSGGLCYYPRIPKSVSGVKADVDRIKEVRKYNDILSWDGILFAAELLRSLSESLQSSETHSQTLLRLVLPTVATALSLVPPMIPMLSQRFGVMMLPHISRCIQELRTMQETKSSLFSGGLVQGKWVIRATGSSASTSSAESEEYVVDFSMVTDDDGVPIGLVGSGVGTTGKSKNGIVSIMGTVKGSALHFVEEWTDGHEDDSSSSDAASSSCIIAARMSLDGRKFEGTYRNVQYGTVGQIAGMLVTPAFPLKDRNEELEELYPHCEALMCLAQCHLASILTEDMAGDHVCSADSYPSKDVSEGQHRDKCAALKEWVSSPFFAEGLVDRSGDHLSSALAALRHEYTSPVSTEDSSEIEKHSLLRRVLQEEAKETAGPPSDLAESVDTIDHMLASRSGGSGSLAALCPSEYSAARKRIICALIYHGNLHGSVASLREHKDTVDVVSEDLITVWRLSLRIMEDSIRRALALIGDAKQSRKEVSIAACDRNDLVSNFLLKVKANVRHANPLEYLGSQAASLYSTIDCVDDLVYLEGEMESSTKRALLRLAALNEVSAVLDNLEYSLQDGGGVSADCLVAAIPRMMGRVWAKLPRSRYDPIGADDLGGYYLARLAGSANLPVESIRAAAGKIYRSVGRLLKRYICLQESGDLEMNSLVISMLAAHITTIRVDGAGAVIAGSCILEYLPAIFEAHRDAIRTKRVNLTVEDDKKTAIRNLCNIVNRDVSRAVLRAAISVVHVLSFQLAHHIEGPSHRDADGVLAQMLRICLKVMSGELSTSIPVIESMMEQETSGYSTLQAKEDWENWCGVCLPEIDRLPSAPRERSSARARGGAGLTYVNENGTGSFSLGIPATSQKLSAHSALSISRSGRPATRSEYVSGVVGFSCQQYLSQWLHMLSCMVKTAPSLPLISSDVQSVDMLLNATGLVCHRNESGEVTSSTVRDHRVGTLVPARFRARILRLLRALLALMGPNEKIVEGLFCLAGVTNSVVRQGVDSDGNLISRETVSLLRYLHLPTTPGWKESIRRVISRNLDSKAEPRHTGDIVLGIRVFLGGSIGPVASGTYVLMKPAAAARLSPEAQASPSSKSHSSLGSSGPPSGIGISSHHVAGNGTEGIVSGLCRTEATAGIVSSVDLKSGACEVILMNRHRLPLTGEDSVLGGIGPSASEHGDERGSSSSRHSLTVRALRTPLSDVAQAEEVPLLVDPDIKVNGLFEVFLASSLKTLTAADEMSPGDSSIEKKGGSSSEVSGDAKPAAQTKVEEVSLSELGASLMTLRSTMSVTSNKELVQTYLNGTTSAEAFSQVLRLASYDNVERDGSIKERAESLSELSKHEAHFSYLLTMLRETKYRIGILNDMSVSFWEKKLSEQLATIKERRESAGTTTGDRAVPSSTSTAPASFSRASARGDGDADSRNSANERVVSQSSASTNSTDEDEESEAAATAASHLREAAIAQMAELGLPRSWAELALRRTGGTNIEAAVHFCLERGGDMERLLAEEQERERMMQRQSSGGSSSRRRGSRGDNTNHLLRQLLEMGFPSRWCAEALAATDNNVDEALTWILTNGERLSAEDLGMEEDLEDGDDADDDEEEDSGDEEEDDDERASASDNASDAHLEENDEAQDSTSQPPDSEDVQQSTAPAASGSDHHRTGDSSDTTVASESAGTAAVGWSGSVTPLRFISGRSIINSQTLAVSGLPSGGFSSVGTKGVLLTSGKWYYEAILETAGCLQIGWADGSFSGHCNADRGDGCGDGPSSWAFDGWRRYRWHATATEWGCRWKEGDVIGCLVDLDEHVVSFTLNGQGEEIGMGTAFSGEGFRPCGGVYACVSFNRREKLRLILGGNSSEPFKHQPPLGYRGVGEAVLLAVEERDTLLSKEKALRPSYDAAKDSARGDAKRFLCDFSDGEHGHELFAWQHRYYGSDASVHLGSSRHSKHSTDSTRNAGSGSYSPETSAISSVSRRVEKVWAREGEVDTESARVDAAAAALSFLTKLKEGYAKILEELESELRSESIALGTLYCRKLILHLMVTLGSDFDLGQFLSAGEKQCRERELKSARMLWTVLDSCVSLRSAGWVGEAGAMAVAAEALGLGISSTQSRQSTTETRAGIPSVGDSDSAILLPSAGISQLLSTTLLGTAYGAAATSTSLAACAEASISIGGTIVFLQPSLQSAVSKSTVFRDLIVAVIRQSVRLLAVVDYAGDDSSENPEDDDMEGSPSSYQSPSRLREGRADDGHAIHEQPDARFTLFLTGLLLSRPVQISEAEQKAVMVSLFEAWSVGLLSASAPWRMVCALTAAGILNMCPEALSLVVERLPMISQFYERLQSTVTRRVWAERAAVPVCSRYSQAMIELLASVRRSMQLHPLCVPSNVFSEKLWVDAATPIPFSKMIPLESPNQQKRDTLSSATSWEWDEGWASSDSGWEVWTGSVECMTVDWTAPSRSAVRTLMDGGEGPPLLRVGCKVMRGLDWDDYGSDVDNGNDDGKDTYEAEKAKREKEKSALEEEDKDTAASPATPTQGGTDQIDSAVEGAIDPSADQTREESTGKESSPVEQGTGSTKSGKKKKKKKRKIPNPKLPVGTVLAIEPWKGMQAMARRVRWDLTGVEGVYRFGGDGGRYDICHVEVNEKSTRVRKRHPLPESAEQSAFRHGFGGGRKFNVLLRLRRRGKERLAEGETEHLREGVLEWPDFGAGIQVECILHADGAVSVTEKDLLYGSKDSGWEARFGQPSYVPGTVMVLTPTTGLKNQAELDARSSFLSRHEELLGCSTFTVKALRNRADGGMVRMTSEMRLLRTRRGSSDTCVDKPGSLPAIAPPPISFDRNLHAPSMSLSRDGRTVTCMSPDGRGTAFTSVGFTKGVHYWEVKLEQADVGSVFIGVAEKPTAGGSGSSSFGQESQPRLNRWHGWGFVNFRATYNSGAERVYGAHCHAGDTVGVLLDCDAGRVSFFFDGLKYGEHILNDLGCAFENISPFGFNADGCGSGGGGQGAPSGVEGGRSGRYPAQGSVRPRALWPVVGLRSPGDRVTLSAKWMTSAGIEAPAILKNTLAVDEILTVYADKGSGVCASSVTPETHEAMDVMPRWFIEEAFTEYERWRSARWHRAVTRGSGPYRMACFGLDVDLDMSPISCAAACAALGLSYALLPGDRVTVKRSAGRMLELAEEAIVLGAYQGRLFYRIASQKSEGGSLTEGGGRAWFWDESEVVDNGIELIGRGRGMGVPLPILDSFRCLSSGGLKIVYEGGAVVRSDLEIFDGSVNIGSIPCGRVIPGPDVLERRVNSCGVVRYRIRFESNTGWISGWIRGGKEEPIVEPVHTGNGSEGLVSKDRYEVPYNCAQAWYKEYSKKQNSDSDSSVWEVKDVDEFASLLLRGIIPGMSLAESDCLLVSAVGAIADFSEGGDGVECTFDDIASPLALTVSSRSSGSTEMAVDKPGSVQAAAKVFSALNVPLPTTKAMLCRIAMLRAFNRRARLALPWLSVRPSQEGNAILGGLCGHGASIDRVGHYKQSESLSRWIQVPSIGSRVRNFRHLFFTSVKRSLLDSIVDTTTTPTPLSHDEYELPREIRTVRINRLKARRAMASDDVRSKRKYSVFSQLQSETRSWGGAALRRGFVAKGHGGQKRAFKVKFIGEGVNDYSGPYREAFTDAMQEIVQTDENGHGTLSVLDASPNNVAGIGDNQDLFMFSTGGRDLSNSSNLTSAISAEEMRIRNSFSSLLTTRDEISREVDESLVFLGRLVGTACRHGVPLDLPLPVNSVWKAIAEEKTDDQACMAELDALASRQLVDEAGTGKPALLQWQQRVLNSFMDGLSNVFPDEILTLLSGEEIRDILCGNPDVDVDLLRRVVEYEGYEETDNVIQFFWEALREMRSDDRKKFLQFVWARNRLPMKESDFDAPFKIQKDTASAGGDIDLALPSASTCFFSLTLPEYSTKDILKQKLLFAIENVFTMESDYVTNDAEVSEGWR